MPKLQIDGKTIANISDDLADRLHEAAKAGEGREIGTPQLISPSMTSEAVNPITTQIELQPTETDVEVHLKFPGRKYPGP